MNAVLDGNDSDLIEIAKSEISNLKINLQSSEECLKQLLIPKDPLDQKDVILEIRAGTGGDEAALFANEFIAHVSAICRRSKIGKLIICLFLILKRGA